MLRSLFQYIKWKTPRDQNTTGESLQWGMQRIWDTNYKREHHNQSPAAVTKGRKGQPRGRGRMAAPGPHSAAFALRQEWVCEGADALWDTLRHQGAQLCTSAEVTESPRLKTTFVLQPCRAGKRVVHSSWELAQSSTWIIDKSKDNHL